MGSFAGIAAACVLGILGVVHLLYPDLAWRVYRRRELCPDDSARFTLRLLGAALLAFGVLVATVALVLF